MTEPSSVGAPHHAHVVVHPVETDPMTGPYRRVAILGAHVGKAYELADVAEFCRRAGLDELDLQSDGMVEWQGGGPEVWEQPSRARPSDGQSVAAVGFGSLKRA